MTAPQLVLWTDIETNGLHFDRCVILEVAFVLTDTEFNELGSFESLVRPSNTLDNWDVHWTLDQTIDHAYDMADDFVRKMHTENGLWQDLRVPEDVRSLDAVAWDVAAWLGDLAKGEKPLMGGASIHFDRSFLSRDFKDLIGLLSHRCVDVSTMKRMGEWWWSVPAPHELVEVSTTAKPHRAMSDIRHTMAEAKAYKLAIEGLVQ